MTSKLHVAVGLSGGVDSAMAAALLVEAGHQVVGVTMTIWDGRSLPSEQVRHACYGPGEVHDVQDARRIAEHLSIPLEVVDLAAEYNRCVLDVCRAEYAAGTTPNPCVHCNAAIKFDLLPEALRRRGVAVDAFATGHYALVARDAERGRWTLRKGKDPQKDQSYFLFRLSQHQLAEALLPLGEYHKADIRRLATERGLPVADKPESQDFIAGGYHSLFSAADARPGPIVDPQGVPLGQHPGIHFFTVGQRRGLGVAAGHRLYVVGIDPARNAVIVDRAEHLERTELVAGKLSWVAIDGLQQPMRVAARIRYRHHESAAHIEPLEGGRVAVRFDEPQLAVTPGQAVVFYDGDLVLGGGTIER